MFGNKNLSQAKKRKTMSFTRKVRGRMRTFHFLVATLVFFALTIFSATTETVFFNYLGASFPADVITPIDFTVSKRINNELPYFTFRFHGATVQTYRLNFNRTHYWLGLPTSEIQKIIIVNENGDLIQEITNLGLIGIHGNGLETLIFEDWNFDGYLDFALPYRGFWATAYFIWDSTINLFVRNGELELLGGRYGVFTDYETERLRVAGGRMGFYFVNYYKYIDSDIVLVESIEEWHEFIEETKEGYVFIIHFTHYKLLDDEMVRVNKTKRTEIWN